LCSYPHAGDHNADYGGDLPEQHVRPLHFPAPDLSCEGSKKCWLRGRDSVPAQCRSKTFIGIKLSLSASIHARGKQSVTTYNAGVL
jgi:hypothetical protein